MNWNRQSVREFNRKNKTNYTKAELKALDFAIKFRAGNANVQSMSDLALNPFINIELEEPIPEGTEVKLNYEVIKNRPTYPRLSQKYKDFIEANKDAILHTTDENAKKGYVCLAEDPDKLWLWTPLFDLLYRNEAGEFVEYGDSILAPKDGEKEGEEENVSDKADERTAGV
nr:MAG TPA: hypothetical protein [Caudoviricetes sp.]